MKNKKRLIIVLVTIFTLSIFSITIFNSCTKKSLPKDDSQKYLISKDVINALANKAPKHLEYFATKNHTRSDSMPNFVSRTVKEVITINDDYGKPTLYVVNYTNNEGFLVLSADIRHEPICAVIETGNMVEDFVPPALISWFEVTIHNIDLIRDGQYDNGNKGINAWHDLVTNIDPVVGSYLPNIGGGSGTTNPNPCGQNFSFLHGQLLPCTWGQRCSYNESCPNTGCNNGGCNNNALTGCVATAIAQVVRYWNKVTPQNYNYSSMPNTYGNTEVQRLMMFAGSSVNMSYGCTSSGAQSGAIPISLSYQFHFINNPILDNYNSNTYYDIIGDINLNHPVLLGGCNKKIIHWKGLWSTYDECHEWVCDGYWNYGNQCYETILFHMNYGWHEQWSTNDYNGYYLYNNWTPGSSNYQYANQIIHHIF